MKVKMKIKKRFKQFMAMFLCILMVSKLVMPTLATAIATGSNSQHIVLNTGDGDNSSKASSSDAPKASSSDADQTTKPENDPKVGDVIWILSGSEVYNGTESGESYTLAFSYEVKITDIILDEENQPEWYEFCCNKNVTKIWWNLWIGKDFKYVSVDNTSVTEPDDSSTTGKYTCTCGENAPENLAEHIDSCPRKQYIISLISTESGYKTAEEIYEDWEDYDAETRTDILNIVEAYASTSYDELLALIAQGGNSDKDIIFVEYDGGFTENGIGTTISAPKGAFPDGTTLTVTDTEISEEDISGLSLDDIAEILGIIAVDISFDGKQPTSNVVVTINIPADKVPDGANLVYIVHFGENAPEIISRQYLNTTTAGKSITFGASSFSSYAVIFTNGKYNSQKMSELLKGDTRYSIETFPVQLFDYNPVEMNSDFVNLYSEKGEETPFLFRGYATGLSGQPGTSGVNNSTAEYAKQGIVQNSLSEDGLPVFNYVGTDSDITKSPSILTGKYLFDKDTTLEGKTFYNTDFQFIYDSETGYYQYKSSANHAQYNSENNSIELYADTLSTKNSYLTTVDLTTYTGKSDYKSISIDENTKNFCATVYDENNNNRLDPYVSFSLGNESENEEGWKAEDIDKIYIKAKIPANVDKNALVIYFKNIEDDIYSEDKRFPKLEYTANGDWIEFVIDTSTSLKSNWNGRIQSIRVDLFDSNLGTSLNCENEYKIEIAQISLIKDYDNYVTRGGFYPFSKIEDSYPGNGEAFTTDSWKNEMQTEGGEIPLSSRSIYNPDADAETLKENLFFGLVMEVEFYIPVDKKVNDKDITYYFSGDDDLWVFVDDQLALDIGGGHGAITGSINFTTGNVEVENAVTVTGYDEMEKETVTENGTSTEQLKQEKKETTLDSSLTASGKHTMKIFYMERCGSVSNCYMKFNLPQIPKGAVSVSKEVEEVNGRSIEGLAEKTFTFTITAKSAEEDAEPLANKSYTIADDKQGILEGFKTDDKGQFTLKDGQKAVFQDIDENTTVYLKEEKPENIDDYQYDSTSVNNKKGEYEASGTTEKDKELKFNFVNQYTYMRADLKISKTGISDSDHYTDSDGTYIEQQSTIYVINGITWKNEDFSMEVVIVGNSTVTIHDLPVGTYTVTEKGDWSWRYDSEKNPISNVVVNPKPEETPEAPFKNKRSEDKWLSGDCWCQNWWGKFKEESENAGENPEITPSETSEYIPETESASDANPV